VYVFQQQNRASGFSLRAWDANACSQTFFLLVRLLAKLVRPNQHSKAKNSFCACDFADEARSEDA